MLKRINLIQGIGTFSQTRSSGFEFKDVSIIFGENRYGKSTFCDIMRSLAEDSPTLITNRQSIPNCQNTPPKVELLFSVHDGSNSMAKFEGFEWKSKLSDCSKIHVFDQSFIHRNVLTGQKPDRSNSENMTSFILGESNTALFEELAENNANLRAERKELSEVEKTLKSHSIENVHSYCNSPLPTQPLSELQKSIDDLEVKKQKILQTIKNIDQIKSRDNLLQIGKKVRFEETCQEINNILASSIENVHQSSLTALQKHMDNHVNNITTFKGWAGQGLSQIIEHDCPFCGQKFSDEAKKLITTYQNSFNDEFDKFNIKIKEGLNNLRQPFSLPNTEEGIIQKHQSNLQIIELYVEEPITSSQKMKDLVISLEKKKMEVLDYYSLLAKQAHRATEVWSPKLEHKYITAYEKASQIEFSELIEITKTYNQAISDYMEVVNQINEYLGLFKQSLNKMGLNNEITNFKQQQTQLKIDLQRVNLEPLCQQYKDKDLNVKNLETMYHTKKDQLEQSQNSFLDVYFEIINNLFNRLGSSDFQILKTSNNRGKKVVYDLQVKFKGSNIPSDKIDTVFSESDRRALALCIFLAKIACLSDDERAKAIIVLDDPVTSFDNERITLILNKLEEIKSTVKQLIITTHYKGMAKKAVKKFRNSAKSIKLTLDSNTSSLMAVSNDNLMATQHDIAFAKIKAFVNRESNEDIITTLRPFFENEIRSRFKKQIYDLGIAKSDLSVLITQLEDNSFLKRNVANRMNAIRDSLNTPMHELGEDALENTRALASEIIDVVYYDLTA